MAVAELISNHRLEVYGMAMFDRTQIYISIAILALIAPTILAIAFGLVMLVVAVGVAGAIFGAG